MKSRDWPIRTKLTTLVAVPVAALLSLWLFATTLALGPALDLLAAGTVTREMVLPADRVITELQRERRLSVVHLAGGGVANELSAQRLRTDEAVADLRRRANGEDLRDVTEDVVDARLDQLLTALDTLPTARRSIDEQQMDRTGAHGLYTGMLTAAFHTFTAMAVGPDDNLTRQARALNSLAQARELLGQADALVAGAFVAGRFAPGEHTAFAQAVGNQRYVTTAAIEELPPATRSSFDQLTGQAEIQRLRQLQDELVAADPRAPLPVAASAWQTTYETVQKQLRDFEMNEVTALTERSVPAALGILGRLAAAGLLGLAAVVISLVVAVRIGRSVVQRLTGIRTAATELADQRLPGVVDRLRRGEEVDVAQETPPLCFGHDEIGEVGKAFVAVQRTAIRSAVDEAALRRGLNQVFLNIARRSQSLVHRQLALLDRMERRTEDPEDLAELFQVDHLATRMRRHAEALVILAGSTPGRGWRNPVAVLDVVRGAISEVEAYHRVDIGPIRPAAVVGRAVGDVIHLLAELIDNATAFSAPASRVRVNGELLPNGYALEITDQGIGMSVEAIDEANRQLARSPEFDPAATARLGHFVVARLAARHGIRVQLRSTVPAGVTAVVLLPATLVTDPPPRPAADPTGADRIAKVTKLNTLPRPRTARANRRRTEPPAVVPLAGARPSLTEHPVGPDGLPRRIRQRPVVRPARRPVAEPTARTPEQVRATMTALQAGTRQGRHGHGYQPTSGPPAPVDPSTSTHPVRPTPERGPTGAVERPAAGPVDTPAGLVSAVDQPTTELPRVRPGGASVDPVNGTGRDT